MSKKQFEKQKIVDYWITSSDDDYKRSFQKRCTPEFTSEWIDKIKAIRLWIKEQI